MLIKYSASKRIALSSYITYMKFPSKVAMVNCVQDSGILMPVFIVDKDRLFAEELKEIIFQHHGGRLEISQTGKPSSVFA